MANDFLWVVGSWAGCLWCCSAVLCSVPKPPLSPRVNDSFLSNPGRKEQGLTFGEKKKRLCALQGKGNGRKGLGANLHIFSGSVNKALSVQALLSGQDQARDCFSVEDTD